MKHIEELGIHPFPWHKEFVELTDEGASFDVVIANEYSLNGEFNEADANLIAAAPELYEALREAVSDKCVGCCRRIDDENGNCASLCMVGSWRKALAKAAGEEAAHGE